MLPLNDVAVIHARRVRARRVEQLVRLVDLGAERHDAGEHGQRLGRRDSFDLSLAIDLVEAVAVQVRPGPCEKQDQQDVAERAEKV